MTEELRTLVEELTDTLILGAGTDHEDEGQRYDSIDPAQLKNLLGCFAAVWKTGRELTDVAIRTTMTAVVDAARLTRRDALNKGTDEPVVVDTWLLVDCLVELTESVFDCLPGRDQLSAWTLAANQHNLLAD